MKELKAIEWIYNEQFDINIKPYLTIEEITVIYLDVIQHDENFNNPIENRVLEDLLLLKVATNIRDFMTDEQILTNEFYDLAYQNGLIDTVRNTVKNVHLIRVFYEEYMSTNNILKRNLTEVVGIIKNLENGLPKNTKGWNRFFDKLGKAVNIQNEHNIDGSTNSNDNAENR